MTSLIEAESKFGSVVRGAGGAIFGIEKAPFVGSRQEEKLQIGTPDGFVKIAVLLNQPQSYSGLADSPAQCFDLLADRRRHPRHHQAPADAQRFQVIAAA